jgi:hypothetical protein
MHFAKRGWALLGFALLAGCHSPSNEDIGRMVLVSAPFWFLMGWLALGVVFRLWRRALGRHGVGLAPSWRPSQVTAIILILAAVLGAATMTPEGWDFFLVGSSAVHGSIYWPYALFIGLGYVTVGLVMWRVWFAFRRSGSFSWALIAVMVVFWLPAVALVLGVGANDSYSLIGLYAYAMFPGFYGVPTAVVGSVLVGEAVLRSRQRPDEPMASLMDTPDDMVQPSPRIDSGS